MEFTVGAVFLRVSKQLKYKSVGRSFNYKITITFGVFLVGNEWGGLFLIEMQLVSLEPFNAISSAFVLCYKFN